MQLLGIKLLISSQRQFVALRVSVKESDEYFCMLVCVSWFVLLSDAKVVLVGRCVVSFSVDL